MPGITPLRALFETLPGGPGDLTLLYRARTVEDLALWGELKQIATERGRPAAVRRQRPGRGPAGDQRRAAAGVLPDIDEHDVYLCGPPGLTEHAYEALHDAGVPDRRIHHESFEL